MHALQALPLLVLVVRRLRGRRDAGVERRVVVVAALLCGVVFTGALVQALAGHPLLPLPPG